MYWRKHNTIRFRFSILSYVSKNKRYTIRNILYSIYLMFFRKNLKYFLIVFVILSVIFVSLRGADNPLKSFFLRLTSPFLKTFRIFSGGVSGFFDFMGSIGDLKGDNERLVEENQKLIAESNQLKDAEKENQELRQQLDLAPRSDYDLEASFVISQDPHGLGNYLLIDKGGDTGIRKGMAVIVADGILVGRVAEVFGNTARIALVADPSSAVNAEAQDSGAKGIVKGEYGLGVKMDMVSQVEVLNEGDTVITSGLGGEIPRGFTIGTINQVGQSADRLFQEASIIPAVNLTGLRVVFVVKQSL
jgi:rod shape-determining protein MreC